VNQLQFCYGCFHRKLSPTVVAKILLPKRTRVFRELYNIFWTCNGILWKWLIVIMGHVERIIRRRKSPTVKLTVKCKHIVFRKKTYHRKLPLAQSVIPIVANSIYEDDERAAAAVCWKNTKVKQISLLALTPRWVLICKLQMADCQCWRNWFQPTTDRNQMRDPLLPEKPSMITAYTWLTSFKIVINLVQHFYLIQRWF